MSLLLTKVDVQLPFVMHMSPLSSQRSCRGCGISSRTSVQRETNTDKQNGEGYI